MQYSYLFQGGFTQLFWPYLASKMALNYFITCSLCYLLRFVCVSEFGKQYITNVTSAPTLQEPISVEESLNMGKGKACISKKEPQRIVRIGASTGL